MLPCALVSEPILSPNPEKRVYRKKKAKLLKIWIGQVSSLPRVVLPESALCREKVAEFSPASEISLLFSQVGFVAADLRFSTPYKRFVSRC